MVHVVIQTYISNIVDYIITKTTVFIYQIKSNNGIRKVEDTKGVSRSRISKKYSLEDMHVGSHIIYVYTMPFDLLVHKDFKIMTFQSFPL
jgi:hypothetical protein